MTADTKVSLDGFLTGLWAFNMKGEQVFPHLKTDRFTLEKGFAVTLTGKKSDYHLVSVEQFLDHIAVGDFDEIGRVRMKKRSGGQSNGFAVRKAMMSPSIQAEIDKRKR